MCHVLLSLALIGVCISMQLNVEASKILKPKVLCYVDNWTFFKCLWDIDQHVYNSSYTYSLRYIPYLGCRTQNCAGEWLECPLVVRASCIWRSEHFILDSSFMVYVLASDNHGHNQSSDIFYIHFAKSVKPSRLRHQDLSIHNITSTELELKWFPQVLNKDFNFRIIFTDTLTKFSRMIYKKVVHPEDDSIEKKTVLSVEGLRPSAKYKISISSRPLYEGVDSGYWSDPLVVENYMLEDVPAAAPFILPCYCIIPAAIEQPVFIYLQRVTKDLSNGKLKKISIEIKSNKTHLIELFKIENAWRSYLSIPHMRSQSDSSLLSNVATSIGFNNTLERHPIHIRGGNSRFIQVEHVVAISKDLLVTIAWTPIKAAASYTVMWCVRKQLLHGCECSNDANFKLVNPHVSSVSIQTKPELINQLSFAVSPSFGKFSGLLKWSPCIFKKHQAILTPKWFFVQNTVSSQIKVVWKEPKCGTSGYASKYIIHLTSVNIEPVNITVKTDAGSFVIDNKVAPLWDFNTYTVRMDALSSNGSLIVGKAKNIYINKSGLSFGELLGIVISCIVIIPVVIVGVCIVHRKCRTCWFGKIITADVRLKLNKDIVNGDPYTTARLNGTYLGPCENTTQAEMQQMINQNVIRERPLAGGTDSGCESRRNSGTDTPEHQCSFLTDFDEYDANLGVYNDGGYDYSEFQRREGTYRDFDYESENYNDIPPDETIEWEEHNGDTSSVENRSNCFNSETSSHTSQAAEISVSSPRSKVNDFSETVLNFSRLSNCMPSGLTSGLTPGLVPSLTPRLTAEISTDSPGTLDSTFNSPSLQSTRMSTSFFRPNPSHQRLMPFIQLSGRSESSVKLEQLIDKKALDSLKNNEQSTVI